MKFNAGKVFGDVYRRRNKALKDECKKRRLLIGHIRIPPMRLRQKRLDD